MVKATDMALRESPILNSALIDKEVRVFKDINIGIATATEKGLIVPVIQYAETKKLMEIASMTESLFQKARQDKLSLPEISGGTFTVSNLSGYGICFFTLIINPPQNSILGVGKIGEKAVVVKGKIDVRYVLLLSLTFDHRAMDGVPAAQFLQKLKKILQKPSLLLL